MTAETNWSPNKSLQQLERQHQKYSISGQSYMYLKLHYNNYWGKTFVPQVLLQMFNFFKHHSNSRPPPPPMPQPRLGTPVIRANTHGEIPRQRLLAQRSVCVFVYIDIYITRVVQKAPQSTSSPRARRNMYQVLHHSFFRQFVTE